MISQKNLLNIICTEAMEKSRSEAFSFEDMVKLCESIKPLPIRDLIVSDKLSGDAAFQDEMTERGYFPERNKDGTIRRWLHSDMRTVNVIPDSYMPIDKETGEKAHALEYTPPKIGIDFEPITLTNPAAIAAAEQEEKSNG